MTNNVTCDKCGHNFAVNQANIEKIRRGEIEVQYFHCPACLAKYHVCTINPKMCRFIEKRTEIQNEIAGSDSARKARRLKKKLDKIIAKQKKLRSELKRRGERILNEIDSKSEEKLYEKDTYIIQESV